MAAHCPYNCTIVTWAELPKYKGQVLGRSPSPRTRKHGGGNRDSQALGAAAVHSAKGRGIKARARVMARQAHPSESEILREFHVVVGATAQVKRKQIAELQHVQQGIEFPDGGGGVRPQALPALFLVF